MRTSASLPVLNALRERIQRLEGGAARPHTVLPFGIKAIDQHLPEGGLALGALHEVAGGVRGCTHLTELLAFLPTAAVQTFAGLRREVEPHDKKPFQLDRCHALETSSETVRRYYPKWYRGAA